MFSAILPFLKSKLAALGAVVVIVLVIAIGGPRLFPRWSLWFYLAALAILIIFLLYLLVKAIQARRKARLLEGFLKKQADDQLLAARPDVKDELAAIREKLERALTMLKRSKLGRGRGGAQALYVLPWYMIIGPSAAGKSTALRNSGLHFPPVDPEAGEGNKVRGLGGTRNCDWWFSNEGIILDTAGRYTISSGGADDREEWSSFLTMLAKARPRAPINGLILAVAVDEILKESDDGREELAKNLRRRIDELILKLEILFPVYVVFTKCDLIAGFVEFFGGLSRVDREQVWGYTGKYEPTSKPVHEEFARETHALLAELERRRLRQLATEIRPAQRRGTYLFPLEFAAALKPLTAFVETLFAPNPYQQNPLIRGFYFTSGTQEGAPVAQVMAAMRRDFGLPTSGREYSEPVPETKAYFIRDLFGEIILPDELNVLTTTAAGRRRRTARFLAVVAMTAATGLLGLALLTSHMGNRSANARLRSLTSETAIATGVYPSFSLDALDSLENLRAALERAERGPGLWRRWGLYSGEPVIEAARQVYFKRYLRLFVAPSAQKLETELRGTAAPVTDDEMSRYFLTATAYTMLTLPHDSVSADIAALIEETDSVWSPTIPEGERPHLDQLLQSQVRYYWKHRRDESLPMRAAADPALLADIQRMTARYWTVATLYRKIITGSNDALGPDYTITEAAPGSTRLSGGRVGLAFTAEGWKTQVQPRIDTIEAEIAANPALKSAFASTPIDKLKEQLTERYVDEFRSTWRTFLDAALVLPMNDLTAAGDALAELSQEGTPMIGVVRKIYAQTHLRGLGDPFDRRIDEAFRPLGRFLGEVDLQKGDKSGAQAYLELMKDMPDKIKAARDGLTQQAKCAGQYRNLKLEFEKRQDNVKRLVQGSALAQSAAAFLRRPLDVAQRAAVGEVCNCINQQWENNVRANFAQLAEAYPFNRASEREVSQASVVSFFSPSGPFFAFKQSEADPAIGEGIPLSGEYSSALQAATAIQNVMPGQNIEIRFRLTASSSYRLGWQLRSCQLTYGSDVFDWVPGPDKPHDYRWPKPGGGDVSFKIDPVSGAYVPPLNFSGDWGLLRLLDQATQSGGLLLWDFPTNTGERLQMKLGFSGSDAGFISDGHFSRFRCPTRVCP
ncbi:MAG: type VI secretion system membrane subunit TssM [Candidatus Zixiibacteriota bacterium]